MSHKHKPPSNFVAGLCVTLVGIGWVAGIFFVAWELLSK